jgi:transcriptional regulator with XRE-family HTH domain
MESMQLPQYLKNKRVLAGHTQSHVAETLGYSTAQFVSNWERGESVPPITILKALAELYRLNPQELFDAVLADVLHKTKEDLTKKFQKVR